MCYRISKFSLTVVNAIFAMFSLITLGIGIWLATARKQLDILVPLENLNTAIGLFIALSVICMAVSLAGCIGALKENTFLLSCYVGVVTGLLSMQLMAIGLAAAFRTSIETNLRASWLDLDKTQFLPYNQLEGNASDTQKLMSHLINTLHVLNKCCGVDNYTDITQNSVWSRANPMFNNSAEMLVPASCCVLNEEGFKHFGNPGHTDWSHFEDYLPQGSHCPTQLAAFHEKGCLGELERYFKGHVTAILVTSGIYVAFYIICITMAGFLVHKIRSGYQHI